MKRLILPAAIACLAWTAEAPAQAPATVEIQEWTVPWADTRPRDPYVDGQNRVWFVGQRGNYIGMLEPASGEFRRIDLPERALPHNIIVDRNGFLWYAGNGDAHIGRVDPNSGEIRRYDMPDPAARDPHTLIFDGNGDIWFTVQGGNFVGKLATATGEVRLVKVPSERSRPYGIVVDAQNRPWFNLFGTNKIGTVDPQTMQLREYTLPHADARGRRIALTPDGGVWYVDYARGTLGRLDPSSGQVREWQTPGGSGSRPYAMTVDDRGRLWFAETGAQPNRLVGFDPARGEFFGATAFESGGGTVRHMVFHAPSREIWFGADTNTVGRARVPS